jgi:hypothetical protein
MRRESHPQPLALCRSLNVADGVLALTRMSSPGTLPKNLLGCRQVTCWHIQIFNDKAHPFIVMPLMGRLGETIE